MRRSNLLVLLVAIVMGGVAAFMARNWIAAQATVAPAPVGTIVVAAAPLTFGTTLTRDNIREISWPAGRLPDGAFSSKEDLLKDGRRALLGPVTREEPILKTKVTGPDQRASLSALLEDGKRAVTVRVDDVRGVAGFVLPGDRVDVVLIRSVNRPNGPAENISDVLLAAREGARGRSGRQRAQGNTNSRTSGDARSGNRSGAEDHPSDQHRQAVPDPAPGRREPCGERAARHGERPRARDRKCGTARCRSVKPPQVPGAVGAVVEIVRGTRSEKYNVTRSN